MPFPVAGIIGFALTHIRGILLTLAIAAAVAAIWGAKHGYDEGKRDEGRIEVRTKELEPLQAQVEAARARASALALQWDEKRKAVEAAEGERDAIRNQWLGETRKLVEALPPAVARTAVPESVRLLINSAVSRANQSAGPAGKPAAAHAPAAKPRNR